LWRASAAREGTAFFNMAEIFRDLFHVGRFRSAEWRQPARSP
jgi:hypothetical protein